MSAGVGLPSRAIELRLEMSLKVMIQGVLSPGRLLQPGAGVYVVCRTAPACSAWLSRRGKLLRSGSKRLHHECAQRSENNPPHPPRALQRRFNLMTTQRKIIIAAGSPTSRQRASVPVSWCMDVICRARGRFCSATYLRYANCKPANSSADSGSTAPWRNGNGKENPSPGSNFPEARFCDT